VRLDLHGACVHHCCGVFVLQQPALPLLHPPRIATPAVTTGLHGSAATSQHHSSRIACSVWPALQRQDGAGAPLLHAPRGLGCVAAVRLQYASSCTVPPALAACFLRGKGGVPLLSLCCTPQALQPCLLWGIT
jgi:hypothetical protein